MTFASFSQDPQHNQTPAAEGTEITQEWWPSIDLAHSRNVVRVNGTVTDERLLEALTAASYSINRELREWKSEQAASMPGGLDDERKKNLYLRAVYFHAKAELLDRYRDFDSTAAGDRRAEDMLDISEDARRTARWAVSELLERPRLTVELM